MRVCDRNVTGFAGLRLRRRTRRAGAGLLAQADDRCLAAGLFSLVRGPAVGKIVLGVAIGASTEVVDLADPRFDQLVEDEAGQVEMLAAAGRGPDATLGVTVFLEELGGKVRADLVTVERNRRADGGDDPRRLGAQAAHGGHRGADDAGEGATPAGMRS